MPDWSGSRREARHPLPRPQPPCAAGEGGPWPRPFPRCATRSRIAVEAWRGRGEGETESTRTSRATMRTCFSHHRQQSVAATDNPLRPRPMQEAVADMARFAHWPPGVSHEKLLSHGFCKSATARLFRPMMLGRINELLGVYKVERVARPQYARRLGTGEMPQAFGPGRIIERFTQNTAFRTMDGRNRRRESAGRQPANASDVTPLRAIRERNHDAVPLRNFEIIGIPCVAYSRVAQPWNHVRWSEAGLKYNRRILRNSEPIDIP